MDVDDVTSDLARKQLYFRTMIVCVLLASIIGVAGFLLPGSAGSAEPFAFVSEPYESVSFLFFVLAFIFFVLYARH